MDPSTHDSVTMFDTQSLLQQTKIPVLDDGFVELIDWMPRMAPVGRTPEYAIVRCARVSTGAGVKSEKEDNALINRLWRSRHTSPFEGVKFTFRIRAPKMVRTHFIRHRTANVNEFSQRYAEVPEGAFYRPSQVPEIWSTDNSIRSQSSIEKQGTELHSDPQGSKREQLLTKFRETEALLDQCFVKYRELMELGAPRELARFCLPDACYTDFYFTMDLNNLLKFLGLRNDPLHAQNETVLFARAMETLIEPLVPQTLKTFRNWNREAVVLSRDEAQAIHDDTTEQLLNRQSAGLRQEFQGKLSRLGLHPNQ